MKKTICAIALCILIWTVKCNLHDLKLKIYRVIDDSYSQVQLGVEERAGHNLTLTCDLSSSDHTAYDDQITWGKAVDGLNFKNETDLETLAKKKSTQLFALVGDSTNSNQPTQSVNRAVKTFAPLKTDDSGRYFCGSLKYFKFKVVYVIVKQPGTNNGNRTLTGANWQNIYRRPKENNLYCNERMFKCKSSDACINQHYVCDKKPDCHDGSDESLETCKGDPCAAKLQCDDGRCIPTSWCCDRHLDVNCNVTYRPPCCQQLSDTYDYTENYVPYNMTQPVRQNGSRYIFITLCILATFFSMLLMLLILSKIFMLAKKARYREARMDQVFHLEDCVYHLTRIAEGTGGGGGNFRARMVCSLETGATDALLVLSDDILRNGGGGGGNVENGRPGGAGDDCPPSYTDVMNLEPPPPYTSQDCLNRT